MSKQKQHYTLIEVLTVIAIIGILAGILFPMVTRSRERAVENKAVAGANAIAMALRNYKMAYSKFPVASITDPVGGSTGNGAAAFGSLNDYDKIIFSLSGVLPGGGKDDANFKTQNRKKTAFLELPPEYMNAGGFYANPWGRRYWIVYSASGSNVLEFKRPENGALGSNKIKIGGEVAVFSEMNPTSKEFKEGSRLATSWAGVIDIK
ncbi:MAG: prepilin-type N-terminal cleavage/methylation domain-containing protein [Lentisphaeria bacterium]|nr:prepilin-type N-terminal cleavage/methylation domain-containing protein [Lentisphaeria bacterium]